MSFTLNNGIHFVETPACLFGPETSIEQEFELYVLSFYLMVSTLLTISEVSSTTNLNLHCLSECGGTHISLHSSKLPPDYHHQSPSCSLPPPHDPPHDLASEASSKEARRSP